MLASKQIASMLALAPGSARRLLDRQQARFPLLEPPLTVKYIQMLNSHLLSICRHHTNLATSLAALVAASVALFTSARADPPPIRHGQIQFTPAPNENQTVSEPFRLPSQSFPFDEQPQPSPSDDVAVSFVTFPSPVVTPEANNNTVHCEYFRPAKPGKYPAVIVLHILGGDFPLARMFAANFAKHNVAALFVKMPYYGERRQPDSRARMISTDAEETVRGLTQAVKDIRYAAAWLSAQQEVDANQLGIFGISLGGITASLAASAEPRFTKVCPLLAGGDLSQILRASNEKHIASARQRWLDQGRSLDDLSSLMKTIDPCTYLHTNQTPTDCPRQVLMLNAANDEVIPRVCTDQLWQAFGRPPIVWYNCGHYSAIFHIIDAARQNRRVL